MAGKLTNDEIKFILSLDAKGVQSEIINVSSKAQDLIQKNKELGSELKVVEKDMDKLQAQMSKLAAAGDTSSEKYERLRMAFLATADDANDLRYQIDSNNKSIENYNKKADLLIQILKVEDMTMDQLKKRAEELEKQFNKTSQSTDPAAYDALQGKLDEVRGRMAELKKGTKETDNIFAQFTTGVNKYWAAIVAGYKTAEGVFNGWKDLMTSNRATGTEFEATMNGVNEALDYAKTAFATMDFTNFIEGMVRSYEAGKAASKMLDELFDRQNSFDLTTMPIKAEIEELKTQMRDVNLSEEERLKITDKIIKKTKEVADLQKDIVMQEVVANEKLLDGQLAMTAAEKDYIIVNYNNNKESIRFAKEILEKENERDEVRRRAFMFSDKFEKARQLQIVETLDKEIELQKQSAEFSEMAYAATKKYSLGNKEMQKGYVDAQKKMLGVDIQTNRELKMTERLRNSLIKSGGLVTEEMKKFNEMTNDELKEWIRKSETASEDFSKNIASAFGNIQSNWNKTEGFLNKVKGALSGFTGMQKTQEESNEYTDQNNIDAAKAIYNRRFGKNAGKAGESAARKQEQKERKELSKINEDLEIAHKEKLTKINLDYLSGEIKTEADFNRQSFAQEQAYYILREKSLKDFVDRAKNEEIKRDASKQLAVVQEKMLSQQVKYQKELEKIILNADPVKKEKQAYDERLDALGLYGETAQSLQEKIATAQTEKEKQQQQQKYEAFLLLEEQYQANLKKIKESGAAQAKKDAETTFLEGDGSKDNPGFKKRKEEMQQELNDLMAAAESQSGGTAAFNAEMEVHKQKLLMIQEETAARKAAGLETTKQLTEQGKIEAQMSGTIRKELEKRTKQFQQYGNTVGQALGNVMTGQEDALQAFGDASIDIVFDILSQIIEAEIIKVMASSTSSIMRATAEAMSTPQSALSGGAAGFATAAILVGAITAATMAAKTALKGLLGKKKGSSSSSSKSDSGKSSGTMTVKQKGYAEGGQHLIGGYTGTGGKYDIKGIFPDGEPYHAGEYIIPKEEMKVPWVQEMVRNIDSTRVKRTKKNPLPAGFAEGGGHDIDPADMMAFGMNSGLMSRFIEVMERLDKKEFKGYWGLTEYQSKLEEMNKEDNRFKKK